MTEARFVITDRMCSLMEPEYWGNPVRFERLPGNRYDTIGVEPLIKSINYGGLLADKAFDANWIIDELNEHGVTRQTKASQL